MKTTVTMWATKAAGAGAVALLLATPAFAQSRGDWSRNNTSNRGAQATRTHAGNNRGQQYNRATQPAQTGTQNQAQQYERSSQAQPAQTHADNRGQYNRSNRAQQQTQQAWQQTQAQTHIQQQTAQ
ncbi:MAG TPA: hypothetical protein VGJ88_05745, partial [Thermoanaerobaculia bacterium]